MTDIPDNNHPNPSTKVLDAIERSFDRIDVKMNEVVNSISSCADRIVNNTKRFREDIERLGGTRSNHIMQPSSAKELSDMIGISGPVGTTLVELYNQSRLNPSDHIIHVEPDRVAIVEEHMREGLESLRVTRGKRMTKEDHMEVVKRLREKQSEV